MSKQIQVKIDDLIIWTDNPRIANKRAKTEEEAKALIYDIVGQSKMIALANDIAENGASLNHLPIVVNNKDTNCKYDVYDGNRRLTIMKDFASNSPRLDKIENKQNYSRSYEITVLLTSKEEAYRLMDLDHAGEQNGRGQISWEAYQRDHVYYSRNMTCMYPEAQQVASICGLSNKADFKKIPYTDLDSIFKNQNIKSLFDIDLWDYDNVDFIKDVYKKLKETKPNRVPYSRYLPKLKDADELDRFKGKMFGNVEKYQFDYTMSLRKSDMFENDIFDVNWIICEDINGDEYDLSDVKIYYYLNNTKKESISSKGTWCIKTKINDVIKEHLFTVKSLVKPVIKFSDEQYYVNNSYSYHQFIFEAKNSKGENCIDELDISITPIKKFNVKNGNIIFKDAGEVVIIARFVDKYTSIQIQDDKKFQVKLTKHQIGTDNRLRDVSIIERHFMNMENNLSFNSLINNLIMQIDSLYKDGNYNETIVAATRAIIESMIFYLIKNTKLTFKSNLTENIKMLFDECKLKKFRTYTANKHKCSFDDIKNVVGKYTNADIESLISILHLGAHKSLSHLTMKEYNDKLPIISLIIELTALYIDYDSQTP